MSPVPDTIMRNAIILSVQAVRLFAGFCQAFGNCTGRTVLRIARIDIPLAAISGFLQISPRDEHPCLPLTLPLTGCVEDFHLLVVLQPPQFKNSVSHGATHYARRT